MIFLAETLNKSTAMKTYVTIKQNPIKAVVNTGTAVNIITKFLIKKLGLQINAPSKIVVIIADGEKS